MKAEKDDQFELLEQNYKQQNKQSQTYYFEKIKLQFELASSGMSSEKQSNRKDSLKKPQTSTTINSFSIPKTFQIPKKSRLSNQIEYNKFHSQQIDSQSNNTSTQIKSRQETSYEKLYQTFGFDSSLAQVSKIPEHNFSDSENDSDLERSMLTLEQKTLSLLNEDLDENNVNTNEQKLLKPDNVLATQKVTSKSTMEDIKLKSKELNKEKKKLTINERINRKKKQEIKNEIESSDQMIEDYDKQKYKTSKRNYQRINDCKKFKIIPEKIKEKGHTTIMIRNIPNKYTKEQMLRTINEKFKAKYDFFYLPIDFNNNCNVGYAFINFVSVDDIEDFFNTFHGKKWQLFNSEKICNINYARIQGKLECENHFKDSSLMKQKNQNLKPFIKDQRKNLKSLINKQKYWDQLNLSIFYIYFNI